MAKHMTFGTPVSLSRKLISQQRMHELRTRLVLQRGLIVCLLAIAYAPILAFVLRSIL